MQDVPEVWIVGAALLLSVSVSVGAEASEVGSGSAEVGAADEGAADVGSGTSIGKPAAAQIPSRVEMTLAWSAGEGHAS